MKKYHHIFISAAALIATGTLHSATVIHNEGFTSDNLALPSSPNYGTNVVGSDVNWVAGSGAWNFVGTPDIQLIWDGESGGANGTGLDTYLNWNGRTNVVQFDGTNGGTANFFITFIPGSGTVGIAIDSFALDAWAGGGDMAVDWSILDGSKSGITLVSGTWTKDNGGGRDTISPGFTGELGQTLVLQFTRISGSSDYLAMDDLTFDQIPEPSSLAAIGLSFCLLSLKRRRV